MRDTSCIDSRHLDISWYHKYNTGFVLLLTTSVMSSLSLTLGYEDDGDDGIVVPS